MTPLNTIIEEEKEEFEKELGVFLMPRKNIEGREWEDKVFPCEGGYCTTDVQDIEDFLTTAMQRVSEAVTQERDTYWKERVKEIYLEILRKARETDYADTTEYDECAKLLKPLLDNLK